MPEYILPTNAKHLQNWVFSIWITGTIWPTAAATGLSVGTLLNKTLCDGSQKLSPCLHLGVEISCRTGQQQMSQALSCNTEPTTSLRCSLVHIKTWKYELIRAQRESETDSERCSSIHLSKPTGMILSADYGPVYFI